MNTRKLLRKAGASFTAVAAGLAPIAMLLPTQVSAAPLTTLSDTMSRLEVSTDSDHTMLFTSPTGAAEGTTITITFPAGFDLSSIVEDDLDLEDDGVDLTTAADCTGSEEASAAVSGQVITFTICAGDGGAIAASSVIGVKIGTVATGSGTGANQITNHATAASYEIGIAGTFGDNGSIEIPVIDDDTVNVTAYIDSFITFDIDTTEVDEDCDAAGGGTPCDTHGGATDNSGYVVSLGELTTSAVNNSGDTVIHADNVSGEINSIYFDLDTNADGGAVVTVDSLGGELTGPSGAIPAVVNGTDIAAGDGEYGINIPNAASTTSGTIVRSTSCDSATEYCAPTTSPTSIFNTNGDPVAGARVELQVAASPDAADGTGTYTDQLTFVATATY